MHFENLLRNPSEVLPQLLKFLGLKEDDNVYQLAGQLLHRDLTLSICSDTINENLNLSGVNEEALLAMAGSDLRNLIFQHSYHT